MDYYIIIKVDNIACYSFNKNKKYYMNIEMFLISDTKCLITPFWIFVSVSATIPEHGKPLAVQRKKHE